MSIVVRKADVDGDREVVIRTLKRYLNSFVDERQYEWLYGTNPFGRVRTWLALDEAGEAVGSAAAFPRPMLMSGQQQLGCVLGDFCISERHRSLGPALQLQKECLASTRTGEYAFCYDFPSKRMTAVYERLGMSPTGSLSRLAKPLRVDTKTVGQARFGRMTRPLARTGDIILRCLERTPTSTFTFNEHCERFGEEFTALMSELGKEYTLCTFRSATYLNWRYKDDPSRQYRVITARTNKGKLVGYVVLYRDGEVATITDLVGASAPKMLQGLVLSAALQLRSEGARRLDFPLIQDSPWIAIMRHIGFFVRESSPVMAWDGRRGAASVSGKLLLLAGDRES